WRPTSREGGETSSCSYPAPLRHSTPDVSVAGGEEPASVDAKTCTVDVNANILTQSTRSDDCDPPVTWDAGRPVGCPKGGGASSGHLSVRPCGGRCADCAAPATLRRAGAARRSRRRFGPAAVASVGEPRRREQ